MKPTEGHESTMIYIEDQRMKDALTKPEVQAVLQDTEIQQLIELLKDNAEEAQRYDIVIVVLRQWRYNSY